MPVYFAICRDKPDSATLRRDYLQAHLEYIEAIVDQVRVAGPLREPGEEGYSASGFFYSANSLREAESLLYEDPYYLAGLYEQVSWQEFIPAAGTWIGGLSWK